MPTCTRHDKKRKKEKKKKCVKCLLTVWLRVLAVILCIMLLELTNRQADIIFSFLMYHVMFLLKGLHSSSVLYCTVSLRFMWERGYREEGDRRRILFIYEVIFLLIEERGSRGAYCLPLMNNVNKCEKEKKCKEQRQQQMRQINMKTKTVCPVYLLKNHHYMLGVAGGRVPHCFRAVMLFAKCCKVFPAHINFCLQ